MKKIDSYLSTYPLKAHASRSALKASLQRIELSVRYAVKRWGKQSLYNSVTLDPKRIAAVALVLYLDEKIEAHPVEATIKRHIKFVEDLIKEL